MILRITRKVCDTEVDEETVGQCGLTRRFWDTEVNAEMWDTALNAETVGHCG